MIQMLFNYSHAYDHDSVESPIEEVLLNHIDKFLDKETQVFIQYPISTISGNFRGDIALKRGDRVVLLECDGEEHHSKEKDDWYDEWRDTLILIQKKADVIYRIKGKDILNNIYAVVSILNSFDKSFFNPDYVNRLIKLDIESDRCMKIVRQYYQTEKGVQIPNDVVVNRKELVRDFDRFWFKYILYSLVYSGMNIHQLIDQMSAKHYDSKKLISLLNDKHPELELVDEEELLHIFNTY